MGRLVPKTKLEYAAAAWLLWLLYRTTTFYFFPYKQALVRYKRSPRAYALITGATAGIGYAFAEELLGHGYGVILLSRNPAKLEAAKAKLKTEYPGAEVETIAFDATNVDNEALALALKSILDLPITIVINNVYQANPDPAYQSLTTYTPEDVDNIINASSRFMTQVSRIMLPTLVRNGPSVILHIGSGAMVGTPYLDVYSGCKAYVTAFATALAREAKAEGWKVDSIAVVPGDVHTEGNSYGHAPGSPTSRQYAKLVLDRIEMAADRSLRVIVPYWSHALQLSIGEQLPERAVQYLLSSTIKDRRQGISKTQ